MEIMYNKIIKFTQVENQKTIHYGLWLSPVIIVIQADIICFSFAKFITIYKVQIFMLGRVFI